MYCLFTACDRHQRPVARTLPERCSRRACRGRRLRLRSAAGITTAITVGAGSATLAGKGRDARAVARFNSITPEGGGGAGVVAGAIVADGRDIVSGAADGDDDDDDHDDDDQEGDANAKGAADSASAETGLGGLLAIVR